MSKRIGFLVALWLGTVSAAPAAEFVQDFRDASLDLQLFRLTGSDPQQFLKPEANGLRITLPASPDGTTPVGIVPRFPVQGDFEITTSFEILQATKPTSGYGIGVSIWISQNTPTKDAASVGRFLMPKGNFFFCMHAHTRADGSRHFRGPKEHLPTDAMSGKLRLKRTGSTLSYLVAPGNSDEFREIYQTDWGAEDLNMVRVAAEGANSPDVLDVLIKDLHIQAESLPIASSSSQPSRPLPQWLPWGGVGVALLGAVGLWVWYRSARSSRKAKNSR